MGTELSLVKRRLVKITQLLRQVMQPKKDFDDSAF